ncbi:CvpA family protein [Helicobacter fennelliae]|uniref:Uncharacterized protein n=2 Tax=Helicobacter fennelliae TaxID=215 RepID=T1CY15_9HELI|nr:CvpA family protein [Helicobacter fennelliae]GAD18840.1 hypothetical protein HFN_2252 [Helicobacter fennelliae MRY12-0050]SQB97492.1 Putative integral membrane protein [Helicobacter fennelliae]STP07004.1 Putative integral membrane protein [Helicobacter fennelliae]STQ83449.1 Putative integral membrane protein [Helicobacter fennelliae]
MNYIDVALIVIIVVIGFRGFATGFIAELCSLIGILLGVYLASIFAKPVGDAFEKIYNFNSPTIHLVLGFVLVLGICWIVFLAISLLLSKRFQFGGLEFINKALGFVFSSVKVFFIFSFIAYVLSHINFLKENFVATAEQKSQMYVNMIKVARGFMDFSIINKTRENIQNSIENPDQSKSIQDAPKQLKSDAKDVLDSASDSLAK